MAKQLLLVYLLIVLSIPIVPVTLRVVARIRSGEGVTLLLVSILSSVLVAISGT
jgi:hypothetical protein